MKTLYHCISIALTMIFAAASAQSQTAETSTQKYSDGGYAHSVGVNAIGLIREFVDSASGTYLNPYLFTYDLDLGKVHLRAGLGPEYRSGTQTHEGFSDSRQDRTFGIDARLGAGSEIVSEGRWKVIAGVDLVGGYRMREITDDSGFDKITTQDESWNIGAGPFFNVTFFLSPRVSIATETALYFRRYERTQTELFENFPEFNNELSKTTGTELDVLLPTALFIQFHF